METLHDKQRVLKGNIPSKRLTVNYHGAQTSFLEAVFARGDRKLAPVLELAVERGIHFDGWDICFNFEQWMSVFKDLEVDPHFTQTGIASLTKYSPGTIWTMASGKNS